LIDRARSIAFSFLTAIPAATIFICTLRSSTSCYC
jgi:hypothetical protein